MSSAVAYCHLCGFLSDASSACIHSSFHDDREKFDMVLSLAGGANLAEGHAVVNLRHKRTINVEGCAHGRPLC